MDFRITADGNERDIREIHEMLKKYNLAHREASQSVPIGIFLEDEMGRKLAGLTGETFGNWLCIRYLFVSESLRGQGIGGRLLETADWMQNAAAANMPLWAPFPFRLPVFTRIMGTGRFFTLEAYPYTGKRHYYTKEIL